MFALARRIESALPDFFVTPAFLDGEPDVRTIIGEIQQEDVIVVPFMASNGYYTNVVFKNAIQTPGKRVQFVDAIGTHPELPAIVTARLSTLIDPSDADATEIIVVGHGTRKNKDSCLTTINLVKQLRVLNPDLTFKFGFIDQNPPLDHVVGSIEQINVLVLPFLMGMGPHTTVDVPMAFNLGDATSTIFQDGFQFPLIKRISDSMTVTMDAPIGTYLELADLCVDIVKDVCWRQQPNKEINFEPVFKV